MEVVEHVADVGSFLAASAALVRHGGMMFLATLNRTPKAFLMAVVGAEYLLRWLPRGTHDWPRLQPPSALAAALPGPALELAEPTGCAYNPPNDTRPRLPTTPTFHQHSPDDSTHAETG